MSSKIKHKLFGDILGNIHQKFEIIRMQYFKVKVFILTVICIASLERSVKKSFTFPPVCVFQG